MVSRLTFIRGLGAGELPLILVVFVVLFGVHKIPALANGLCKGICEFKQATKDI